MSFWQRLVDPSRRLLARLHDQRSAKRYPVRRDYPIEASLERAGSSSAGALADGGGDGWSCALLNLCDNGASLRLPLAMRLTRGERVRLRLRFDEAELVIGAVVAHFAAQDDHAVTGLYLEFNDPGAQRIFAQLLEGLAAGASLVKIQPALEPKHAGGRRIECYQGDRKSRLTVWRRADTRQIESIELVLGDHCLRGQPGAPALQYYFRHRHASHAPTAHSAPDYSLVEGESEEARRIFRWMVPNLSEALPADLRALLRGFVPAATPRAATPVMARDHSVSPLKPAPAVPAAGGRAGAAD